MWPWSMKPKALPTPMFAPGPAAEQIQRNRDARLRAEAADEAWAPRGAAQAAERIELGGGVTLVNVSAARYGRVTEGLRTIGRIVPQAGGYTRGLNLRDEDGAVERVPPPAMLWRQVRALADRVRPRG